MAADGGPSQGLGPNQLSFEHNYAYTPAGKVAGKVTAKTLTLSSAAYSGSLTAGYTYDNQGTLMQTVYPGCQPSQSCTFTYTLDGMERPTQLEDNLNKIYATGVTYNAANQSSYGRRTYNNLLQLTQADVFEYKYSATRNNGQIVASGDMGTGEVATYQYDALKRLSSRGIDLGGYVPAAQALVPRTEAPVRDLQTPRGWRVVASVYLDHKAMGARAHICFFAPGGALRWTQEVMEWIEQTEIGTLFGDPDEIFAVTSNEEHAYNVQTQIWLLPRAGKPKLLLAAPGVFQHFTDGAPGNAAGVMLALQTYDGVHADTKRSVEQFYAWDPSAQNLTPRPK